MSKEPQVYPRQNFRVVPGFENYLVGDRGTVLSCGVQIGTECSATGYTHVILCKDGIDRKNAQVHRLMVELFWRKLKKGEVVHHINHNKSDNRMDNFEIRTLANNTSQTYKDGLNHGPKMSEGKQKRFTLDEVNEIKAEYASGETSMMKLSVKYDRNLSSMFFLLNGTSYVGPGAGRMSCDKVRHVRKLLKEGAKDETIQEIFNISAASLDNIRTRRSYRKVMVQPHLCK